MPDKRNPAKAGVAFQECCTLAPLSVAQITLIFNRFRWFPGFGTFFRPSAYKFTSGLGANDEDWKNSGLRDVGADRRCSYRNSSGGRDSRFHWSAHAPGSQ